MQQKLHIQSQNTLKAIEKSNFGAFLLFSEIKQFETLQT